MKKVILKIYFYIKYPNQFIDKVKYFFRIKKAGELNIKFLKPNYLYKNTINSSSIIIDVGCGYLAELSIFFINTYGAKAYGVDPTYKHKDLLQEVENKTKGRFKHLEFAVSSVEGKIVFHETYDHESGSILKDHVNILRDNIHSYEVETKKLKGLVSFLNLSSVDYLKLDLEGAEYELLKNVESSDLAPFNQIFVEFHHRAIKRYSSGDTKKIVSSICSKGFKSFTLDDVNYLFYRE
jgi:FkbM family methyltransferase